MKGWTRLRPGHNSTINFTIKMITPRFYLDQTDTTIKITILIKYAKIKSVEIDVQDTLLLFYLRPYHLRLSFPCALKSDGTEKIEYDLHRSELHLTIPKQTPGEHFPDLALTSTLLQTKPAARPPPSIVPLDESEVTEDLVLSSGYGFNHKEQNFFLSRAEEMFELFDLDPDSTAMADRVLISSQQEDSNWDLDRYFEDLDLDLPCNADLLQDYLPSLVQRMDSISLDNLIKIGNKSLLLHNSLVKPTLVLVAELVLCFCYEIRSMGEISCESAANINKLSPGICCLIEFESLYEMLRKVQRRVLAYGVYRNLRLVQSAWKDCQRVFDEGKEAVVRVLLKVKKAFEGSEPRFLINRIWVDDLVVWVQKSEDFVRFVVQVRSQELPDVSELGLNFKFNLEVDKDL